MPIYNRLIREQRYTIEAISRKGSPQIEIAKAIIKHPSTGSRELRLFGGDLRATPRARGCIGSCGFACPSVYDLCSLPDLRRLGELGGDGWRAGKRSDLALLAQCGFELERGFAESSVRDFHDGLPDE